MADQLSLRGGTTTEHATFTGANKEVTVDTTKKTLVVNDGATVGGHPLMRENASNSALALGSAGTPSLKFTGDTNTGIYSPGADQVSIATNGTERLRVDNAGQIEAVSLGTATAPTFSFVGDPNTGIYSPGADQLAVATNGTGRLFVDASGNVGIGAASFGYGEKLGVGGTILTSDGTVIGRITSAVGVAFWGTPTNHPLAFQTNGAERLRITSAGLVGIGTSSPGQALSVAGSIAATTPNGTICQLTLEQTSQNAFSIQIPASTQRFAIKDLLANVERFVINSAGNVGIGTTAPLNQFVVSKSGAQGFEVRPGETATSNGLYHFNRATASYVSSDSYAASYRFFIGGSSEAARIDSSGRLLVGTGSDSGGALFQVNGDRIRVGTAKTPATSGATGTTGEIAWDADYIYVCTATNTWKRSAIATW